MTGWTNADAALPSSHVFVTVARGRAQKTIAVSYWVAIAMLGLVALAGLWLVGSTFYVASHDTLVAGLMRHERDIQDDYEDRIASLKRQLDRSASQHAQLERSIETRLDALAAQEADLRRKAGMVATIAQQVLHTGTQPGAAGTRTVAQIPVPTTALGDAAAVVAPSPTETTTKPRHDATAEQQSSDRLAALATDFGAIAADQEHDLGHLQAIADSRLARYRGALTEAGLSVARFESEGHAASGGPFVPLDAGTMHSSFDRATLTLGATLAETDKMQSVVTHIPFEKPLWGTPEVTSPFGARIDPFLGRPALHTGIDLREETGANVLATASGRVSFAGPASGYGTMVELDHGAGLSTRYAHLSAATVTVGESVEAGTTIGEVGATGRATGPHLHYETRIDGEPVDPMRFLQAGHRLAQADAP